MTLLRRWFAPAPDSSVADALRCGKSPWKDAVHLLWSAWLFITPLFDSDGYSRQWLGLTLLSYPIFLLLYARVLLAPRRHGKRYALGMVALSLVLLGPYPSGMSYFVFGCVMLRITERVPLWRYLLEVIALNAVLAAVVVLQGYPWQIIAWMLPMTLVIVTLVYPSSWVESLLWASVLLTLLARGAGGGGGGLLERGLLLDRGAARGAQPPVVLGGLLLAPRLDPRGDLGPQVLRRSLAARLSR